MPTPKGGGIGIFFVFLMSAGVLGLPVSFWLPIVVMAMVAFWGDRIELSALLRLVVQVDELSNVLDRLKDGENLTKPHRRHYYQLLANEKGIAHWKVSVGYGVFQVAVGISVLLVRVYGVGAVLGVLTGWFGAFWVESCRLRKSMSR